MPHKKLQYKRLPESLQSLVSPENSKSTKMGLAHTLVHPAVHIDFTGNQEALVEGCTGVIEYNDHIIRLNTDQFILKFTGRNLQVSCMTEESMIVKGFIVSLEYLY